MARAKYIGLVILVNLALLPWTAVLVMRATEITRSEARMLRSAFMMPLQPIAEAGNGTNERLFAANRVVWCSTCPWGLWECLLKGTPERLDATIDKNSQ